MIKANTYAATATQIGRIVPAPALPSATCSFFWREMDDRTGARLYDHTALDERVAELAEFAVLIFEHARLTHSHLADLHRAPKKSTRSDGKRRK